MKGFIIICCVIVAVYGQAESPALQDGPCSSIKSIALDIPKFSGNWYGCKENSVDILGRVKCSLLTLQRNGTHYWYATYSGVSEKTGKRISMTATANIEDQKLTFATYNTPSGPLLKNYTVLSTDYDNYAVVSSCETIGSQHKLQMWLNAREPNHCSNYDQELENAIKDLGVNTTMTLINQKNCTYY